jgi:hypothetical protein
MTVHLLTGVTMSGELYRLPFLFSHYSSHINQYTVINYLKAHYGSPGEKEDGDEKQDHQLPFKSTSPASSSVHATTPQLLTFSFAADPVVEVTSVSNHASPLHGYKARLLQPPRL